MQIKRFEAPNMPEALRQVKETLGSEAIILSTKTLKTPFPRLGRSKEVIIEVVAAVDRQPAVSFVPAPVVAPPPAAGEEESRDRTSSDEAILLQNLLSTGLGPEFARGLTEEIQALRKDFDGSNLTEVFRNCLQWKLMDAVQVTGPSPDISKVWSLVGPTGVGKTTTLAKLAAYFPLKEKKKITLITFDTYRIGAVEQLQIYARLLHLPLEVAHHREELKRIIERHRHQDLVLIDTVGRSPNDTQHLDELRSFLTVHPLIENHLLLSATTKERDLERIVQQYSV
jgi:flagellar biosynthesis protein FlhF